MTFNSYLLSLAFGLNGTASGLVILSAIGIAGLTILHLLTDDESNRLPGIRNLVILFFVSLAVVTVVPDKSALITAVALEQGPELARDLIKLLGESK